MACLQIKMHGLLFFLKLIYFSLNQWKIVHSQVVVVVKKESESEVMSDSLRPHGV